VPPRAALLALNSLLVHLHGDGVHAEEDAPHILKSVDGATCYLLGISLYQVQWFSSRSHGIRLKLGKLIPYVMNTDLDGPGPKQT
jgi:hypothetical protein